MHNCISLSSRETTFFRDFPGKNVSLSVLLLLGFSPLAPLDVFKHNEFAHRAERQGEGKEGKKDLRSQGQCCTFPVRFWDDDDDARNRLAFRML